MLRIRHRPLAPISLNWTPFKGTTQHFLTLNSVSVTLRGSFTVQLLNAVCVVTQCVLLHVPDKWLGRLTHRFRESTALWTWSGLIHTHFLSENSRTHRIKRLQLQSGFTKWGAQGTFIGAVVQSCRVWFGVIVSKLSHKTLQVVLQQKYSWYVFFFFFFCAVLETGNIL